MKALFFLLALFIAIASSSITRRQILDETQVRVKTEGERDGEHFQVDIDHVEEQIEDGKVLSSRDISLSLRFDVHEDSRVSLNGLDVPLGFSELSVKLEVKESGKAVFGELLEVKVRIFVAVQQITTPQGDSLTKVIIQERVVGIESREVWQATVFEKGFIIHQNGEIKGLTFIKIQTLQGELPQDHPGTMIPEDAGEEQEKTTCRERMIAWWNAAWDWFYSLSFALRIAVSFGIGFALGLVLVLVSKCLRSVFCSGCNCPASNAQNQVQNQVQNNQTQENYKANLRVYSVQYTADDEDEKDEKKKKKTLPLLLV